MMLLRWNFTFTLVHCGLMYYGNDSPVNATDNCPLVFKTFSEKNKASKGNSSSEFQSTGTVRSM